MAHTHVLAIVLAGGEGKRLMPLTADRAKPAVPFGGHYRLIDFALSNIVNSGYMRVVVLTQYKSHSLDRHVTRTWYMSPLTGNFVAPMPAQQRRGPHWYLGSADAIYQSLNIVDDERPDYILIVGADNIYRMDFSQMVDHHIASGLPATVAGIRQPVELAPALGVIDAKDGVIRDFLEKPTDVEPLPDDPSKVLASMGNYVFTTTDLVAALRTDAADPASGHDMGGSIIPSFVARGECGVYDFQDNDVPGSTTRDRDYWRDVGTLDAYYEANMDLISVHPIFNLYNREWPTMTMIDGSLPPAKFVYGDEHSRMGHAVDSFVSPGTIISGGEVYHSIISPGVYVHSWAQVTDSVVMDGTRVGRHAIVSKAILDKNVRVEEGAVVGVDLDRDRERGFTVTDSGITVVPKGMVVAK
ncbi:MAG: glucose-1-phosphate adenylyltransferase [Actinomyces sp.]|jgi:glucose-1-phosphate adenylyltransferase|nr:glucose-1-phosphate adenylyltransferase [Actinomyces sp.]MCI1641072.1 glucose-1-phosphate adenylyltransferase [Actinomyces sp.]MCI1661440.1 glucose-1-phosphate adenylyltransferase [Actinomyces sp.]MCI1690448.1 glucose-1-phosphate adenylyltransferase [Actinomyces sp.]MCI1787089.1 glucose-1-phosphate adenylyltransferase [Actinomyces sp.]MCI1829345.1 glucose-1-phosphate adenylyltransferase [Actinomyces sp.]